MVAVPLQDNLRRFTARLWLQVKIGPNERGNPELVDFRGVAFVWDLMTTYFTTRVVRTGVLGVAGLSPMFNSGSGLAWDGLLSPSGLLATN